MCAPAPRGRLLREGRAGRGLYVSVRNRGVVVIPSGRVVVVVLAAALLFFTDFMLSVRGRVVRAAVVAL